jgi:putative spermidine/putrescine transport system substrate-binding protein
MKKPNYKWLLVLFLLVACSAVVWFATRDQELKAPRQVHVVSWGGQFQADLVQSWLQPAAQQANIKLQTEAWSGDYGALTTQLQRGTTDWDLIHVEDFFIDNPNVRPYLAEFTRSKLKTVLSELSEESVEYAIPVHAFAYVLTFRPAELPIQTTPSWSDFFNPAIKAKRGVRDSPLGVIEASLLSKGKDLEKTLYDKDLTPQQLEELLNESISQMEAIKDQIVWWTSGDQLQRGLTSGEMVMAIAWSGRVKNSHASVNGSEPDISKWRLRVNPETAIVSADYWVIPKSSSNSSEANELLESLYLSKDSEKWASEYAAKQAYLPLVKTFKASDAASESYLKLASPKQGVRMSSKFWGNHYSTVMDTWRTWRSKN